MIEMLLTERSSDGGGDAGEYKPEQKKRPALKSGPLLFWLFEFIE